jgi:hypothetical protein
LNRLNRLLVIDFTEKTLPQFIDDDTLSLVGVPDETVLNRILKVRERLYAVCGVFERA